MTKTPDEHGPDEQAEVDIDAAGRGETEPELDQLADPTDAGSLGGENGGA